MRVLIYSVCCCESEQLFLNTTQGGGVCVLTDNTQMCVSYQMLYIAFRCVWIHMRARSRFLEAIAMVDRTTWCLSSSEKCCASNPCCIMPCCIKIRFMFKKALWDTLTRLQKLLGNQMQCYDPQVPRWQIIQWNSLTMSHIWRHIILLWIDATLRRLV